MASKDEFDKLKNKYPGMDITYALHQSPAGKKFGGKSMDKQYAGLKRYQDSSKKRKAKKK